ncbi:MAG TPA: SRPBCC family protein [Planktothrix sp.]|jgi:uncharacterized protein YndB with AHSA1/START domain
MPTKNKSAELKIIRIFDAPVDVVWDAWTDPEQAAKWWGPRGFTITHISKDLRPGGHWKYTMHGPDGTDYPNITKYFEVEKYKKLVYDHGGTEENPPLFRVTVLFSESGDKTKMDMTMSLPTPEAAEETRKFIKKAGGDSTWDRLAEYLEKKTHGKEKFVINRSFDAPLDVVFEAWTDPDQLAQWMAPAGMKMSWERCELKEGGISFYSMSNGTDFKLYGRCHYLEIQKPRLVYKQQFCDAQENMARHPLEPRWPEYFLTTVVFTEEGQDRTRVTLTWEPTGEVASDEWEAFLKQRNGMTQGWTGSFDKLEAFLAK